MSQQVFDREIDMRGHRITGLAESVEPDDAVRKSELDSLVGGGSGAPTGSAGGQLGGTFPNPDVRGLRETSGPTLLTLDAIADGQVIQRVGSTLAGVDGLPPGGSAGGQLGGTFPNPDVRGLRETSGPTLLDVGDVADGEYLTRHGDTFVGGTPAGGGGGGGGDPLWIHFAEIAADDSANVQALTDSNLTVGWKFIARAAGLTVTGVRAFFKVGGASKTLRLSLWNATGRMAFVDVVTGITDDIFAGVFASSQALTRGETYWVTAWNSGTYCVYGNPSPTVPLYAAAASTVIRGFWGGPGIQIDRDGVFDGTGDVKPNTPNSGVSVSWIATCEPTFE